VIDVTLSGKAVAPLTARFGVTSDLRGQADTCVLMVADKANELEQTVERGDPLVIRWGYGGGELTEIFRGVVRRPAPAKAGVGVDGQVVVLGVDYNTILNSRRVRVTFEDETASGVIRALTADTGLGLEVEECRLEIDRLPLFDQTLRQAIDAVTDLVRREAGEEYFDYIRGGVFHWRRKDYDQAPVQAFKTGVDIIRLERLGDGLSFLETLVTPVHHSEVVEVDGERCFVVKTAHLWESGGRTRIWFEDAG